MMKSNGKSENKENVEINELLYLFIKLAESKNLEIISWKFDHVCNDFTVRFEKVKDLK